MSLKSMTHLTVCQGVVYVVPWKQIEWVSRKRRHSRAPVSAPGNAADSGSRGSSVADWLLRQFRSCPATTVPDRQAREMQATDAISNDKPVQTSRTQFNKHAHMVLLTGTLDWAFGWRSNKVHLQRLKCILGSLKSPLSLFFFFFGK